jgi:hypothetical protein
MHGKLYIRKINGSVYKKKNKMNNIFVFSHQLIRSLPFVSGILFATNVAIHPNGGVTSLVWGDCLPPQVNGGASRVDTENKFAGALHYRREIRYGFLSIIQLTSVGTRWSTHFLYVNPLIIATSLGVKRFHVFNTTINMKDIL